MKKLILAGFMMFLLAVAAQVSAQNWEHDLVVKRGFVLKENQAMELRRTGLRPLKKEARLKNGYTLYPDGRLVSESGVRRYLRDGEGITRDGHIMFSEKRRGRLVLVDSPVNFYAVNADGGARQVKTVTGVDPKDIPIGGPGNRQPAKALEK